MTTTLVIEDLWWPFGAHLIHAKWAYIQAIKNGYEFFYKKNGSRVFFRGNTVHHYYDDVSTIKESDINPEKVEKYIYSREYLEERYAFKPDNYATVEEFHQDLLHKIYKPNAYIRNILNNNQLYRKIKDENLQYIGMHIRLSDKVWGPSMETNYIDMKLYADKCIELCNTHNIKNIVLCCDTNEAVEYITNYIQSLNNARTTRSSENEELSHIFSSKANENDITILYNTDETRCPNDFRESAVWRIQSGYMSNEELEREYFAGFFNFEYLLNAFAIVGNWDSCFILAAAEYRRNPLDYNINTSNPPKWGIQNRCGY
jgi:hypothetical protein